jgi:hypothetical protein
MKMNYHNTPCLGGEPTQPVSPVSGDCVNYRSQDGLVEVVTKVTTANRYPKHDYPIVCLRFRPQNGTRIQRIPGTDAVEILLSHHEVVAHLKALNRADTKSHYTWLEIPEKPAERKAFWHRKNQERWNQRQK